MTALRLTKRPACRLRFTDREPADLPCRRCGSDLSLARTAFLHAETLQREDRYYEGLGYTRAGKLSRLVLPDVDELIYWKALGG